MDKLEIKQGSFIQQTQYFIPVEIDLSVIPACLGIWFFHLSRRTTVIQDLLVQRQFSLVPDNRTNVNVEAWNKFMTQTDNPYQGCHVQITHNSVSQASYFQYFWCCLLTSTTQHTFQKWLQRKYVILLLFIEVVMFLFDNSFQKVYLFDL